MWAVGCETSCAAEGRLLCGDMLHRLVGLRRSLVRFAMSDMRVAVFSEGSENGHIGIPPWLFLGAFGLVFVAGCAALWL
jgi:hypothetical protein